MRWKFEYALAILVLIILSAALYGAFTIGNMELVNTIVVALVAAFSGITGFFFTKHRPDKDE